MRKLILVFPLLLICLITPVALLAADIVEIQISSEIGVNVLQFNAEGDDLLLWLPSESGQLEEERKAAQALATSGTSVWMADVLSAWFLPALPSSIESIPATELAVLLEKVRQLSNKRVFLLASGRGALLCLRLAQAWQQRYGDTAQLGGVLMISPKLFVETPEPGMPGKLLPVVRQSNLPIFIIQPANSPWRWKLDRMLPALASAGSDVYARILEQVRDRFYYRPDATDVEEGMAQSLPVLLRQSVVLLAAYNNKSRVSLKPLHQAPVLAIPSKKERRLRDYQGDPSPPPLALGDLHGKIVDLEAFKGKVVLVNFWASWCPPCVHEMPSMQKLADHFAAKDFEILAVNMAESERTVRAFLKEKVNVQFPILMDSDGAALKRWQVFAFPTSYVIDKQGRIRLALFGAIDWMQADVLQQIDRLLAD